MRLGDPASDLAGPVGRALGSKRISVDLKEIFDCFGLGRRLIWAQGANLLDGLSLRWSDYQHQSIAFLGLTFLPSFAQINEVQL